MGNSPPDAPTYAPPPGLRNRHVNTILASAGPRKWLMVPRARALRAISRDVLLDCRNGVRLHGVYAPHDNPRRGLAILIHGWEGSAESTYLLSATHHLYARGFAVFRLHLRDHGPTHHLNREPFLAIRLDEVLDALEQIQALFPHERTYLAGFSLGGNMAVRAAAHFAGRPIGIDRVAAVCPPIDPLKTGEVLREAPVYNGYFVKKWRRSFRKKIALFPEHAANADIFTRTDLISLHEAFVPRYSDHPNAASYFRAYTLNATNLPRLDAPCHILLAADDPIVPAATAALLPALDGLTVEVTERGGHCGFIQDYALRAWSDARLDSLFR